MNLEQIRECMYEMTNYTNMSKTMYEIMQKEGFLPETLDEGDSNENHFSAMMEDDDMCQEMFECVSKSEQCSDFIKEWLEGKSDLNIEEETEEGYEASPMVTKQIDEEPEGHMYIARLHRMKEFIEEILNKVTPDEDLDAWVQDKITMSYQNLESVSLYLSGEEESGTNTPETNDVDIEIPTSSLMGSLSENELPKFDGKKGQSVDAENKKNGAKDDNNIIKNADKTQKTIQQKVEDNINVKFSPGMESDDQKEINKSYLGAWNMLNLDFQNGVPDSYKKRVELEVTTGHSRKRDEAKFGKEANVDHESTERIGKAMMAASKANQEARDDMYDPNPIITQPYQKTSITGGDKKAKGEHNSGKINEQLTRILEIMGK